MLRFQLFLLLHLLKLSSLELIVSSNYSKPDKYFINCGSNSNTSISDDRIFVGDLDPPFSLSFGRSKDVKDTNPSNNTPSLYRTARISDRPFSYELRLSNHNRTHVVRLHFFSFSTRRINLSVAVFDVSTSGLSLLSNFTVGDRTGIVLIEEFLVTVKEGLLRLCFVPSQKLSPLAFVNAIEVFPTPDNFISDSASLVTSVASNSGNKNYTGLLSLVLHPVHRINVGGPTITPETDTLWRKWLPDEDFLSNSEAARKSQFFSGKLAWHNGVTEYTAPESIFRTAKVLNVNSNFFKMRWRFPVKESVAHHLVRVHFCYYINASVNFLEFSLFIFRNFEKLVNPFKETNEFASPFYYDFVVDSSGSPFINVSIGLKLEKFSSSTDLTPFLNGLEIFEMQKKTGIVLSHNQLKKNNNIMLAGVCVACVVVFMGISISGFLVLKSKKTKPDRSTKLNLKLKISLSDIQRATRKFDEKLVVGQGGFGKVYKGNHKGMNVAVKWVERGHGTVKRGESDDGQGLHEFKSEIRVLSQIRHKHLVSLIGYCDDKYEMILVYEFMEKGTLREHLYDTQSKAQKPSMKPKLSWEQRLEICIGPAKGLNYLHTSSSEVIIHRDVKSSNILLDENYVAKVADFGLSKAGPPDPNNESIDLKGSFGYFDPEYIRSSQYTVKSDVYSFGVVLLEVLCARPAIFTLSEEQDTVSLAKWGILWRRKGQLEKIIDPLLVGEIHPESLKVVGEIAEKCLKESGSERPTMQEVEWHLNHALQLQRNQATKGPFDDDTSTKASPVSAS
ncbi:putative receptor-like protein kinase [Morus notabilis]|uniref:Putative receptor-like protein kinase n=1 Tax=Morus notabilis TaxID=981085 RepID=W9RC49_9ROSA|nr:probable receptor-like protein kinase At5g24010 [Morus notabilis]EXB81599.1 putative receptor-like protein kinase [Morus notabilis]